MNELELGLSDYEEIPLNELSKRPLGRESRAKLSGYLRLNEKVSFLSADETAFPSVAIYGGQLSAGLRDYFSQFGGGRSAGSATIWFNGFYDDGMFGIQRNPCFAAESVCPVALRFHMAGHPDKPVFVEPPQLRSDVIEVDHLGGDYRCSVVRTDRDFKPKILFEKVELLAWKFEELANLETLARDALTRLPGDYALRQLAGGISELRHEAQSVFGTIERVYHEHGLPMLFSPIGDRPTP